MGAFAVLLLKPAPAGRRAGAALLVVQWAAAAASAHPLEGAGASAGPVQLPWSFEPWIVACLLASAVLYSAGLARLWRKAGVGRGIARARAASFAGGWLALVAALVSPLDALGAWLFSAHMLEHELLMIVAAPLLVLARPLAVWTWAIPATWRRALGRAARWRGLSALWSILTEPVAAWSLHALALWLWHVPALFEAALANRGLHTLQHASFLASALLFWWAVLGSDRRRAAHGASLFYLFTTMVHTGALGALLALAPTAWYPSYFVTSSALGFDPVDDQQLGGLLMWVPGGLAYLIAALVVAAQWLGRPSGWLYRSGAAALIDSTTKVAAER